MLVTSTDDDDELINEYIVLDGLKNIGKLESCGSEENVTTPPIDGFLSLHFLINALINLIVSDLVNNEKSWVIINCFKFSLIGLPTVKFLVLTEISNFNWYK